MGPFALRSLLLAGDLSVSTQEAVTTRAKAAPKAVALAFVFWGWTVGVALSGAVALAAGAAPPVLGPAMALALAPALAGFVLLPGLGRALPDLGLVMAWIVAAAGLAAGSGGATSPMALSLVIAPLLAGLLRRSWAPEAGAAAVLVFAIAAWLGRFSGKPDLGVFSIGVAIVALATAIALIAVRQMGAVRRAGNVVGQRVAEVSHELRTPLTHILGFSEMIERRMFGDLDARYVEYAGLIRRSGAHLLGLVNDLLDLSKIEAGRYDLERAEFDVRLVVAEVVRMSSDAAQRKNVMLGVVTPDAPLMVRADEAALRRMLINTVGNAVKFTHEGGRIIVKASADHGALVLDTIDNGPGFPTLDRDRLGQAFERGPGAARVEGSGLGLSLVGALARLHDGEVRLLDAPGGGALVSIILPVLKPL